MLDFSEVKAAVPSSQPPGTSPYRLWYISISDGLRIHPSLFFVERVRQMSNQSLDDIYTRLKFALREVVGEYGLAGGDLNVRCGILDTAEAIGSPEHNDYPIQSGREYMVEAEFRGSRGQAFSDSFENFSGTVEELSSIRTDTTARRAVFIASLNAVYRHCGLCEKTVHCRDEEPRECAEELQQVVTPGEKIALVGLQPRFLEYLARIGQVRVMDLDPRNIGTTRSGILVESPEMQSELLAWCDRILATGSTIVNGTIVDLLNASKPIVFFGVTISAAAGILDLELFCRAPVR